jgi:ABC-type Na+ efflux pump permease subunit
VFAFLGLTLILAGLAFREGPGVGQGLYRIGVLPDGPALLDRRFVSIEVDPATGNALLSSRVLDAYLADDRIVTRPDRKSLVAAGALKSYLEKLELTRISDQYDLARAFPLRVEVNYLTSTVDSGAIVQAGSLAQLLPSITSPDANESPAKPTAATPDGDAVVREQLQAAEHSGQLPQVKVDPGADRSIVIPSLLTPPLPFAQVLIAFIYVLPVSFVSVFFVSSFMDEKINRRLTMLMSAPVTPLQIILGKLLPYAAFSIAAVIVVTLIAHGDVPLSLAIFSPVILFIFAVYLTVPMLYRTFKDTTFMSMAATALTTTYLIFPAVFSGVNDLAYISPLTLVVKMYRGETFGLREYLFSVVPMAALFGLSLYVATRVLNEEYLLGYKPLYRKLADAIFLSLNRRHPFMSIFVLSLLLIPLVYMIQLALLAMSTNLPLPLAIGLMVIAAALVEELAKSIGIFTLIDHGLVRSARDIVGLAGLSALGFLIGEKLLLFISLSVVSGSFLSSALFDTGALALPLMAHCIFTSIVCLLRGKTRVRYLFAVVAGALAHAIYNWLVLGGVR